MPSRINLILYLCKYTFIIKKDTQKKLIYACLHVNFYTKVYSSPVLRYIAVSFNQACC